MGIETGYHPSEDMNAGLSPDQKELLTLFNKGHLPSLAQPTFLADPEEATKVLAEIKQYEDGTDSQSGNREA